MRRSAAALLAAFEIARAHPARAEEPSPSEEEAPATEVVIRAPPPSAAPGQTQLKGDDAAKTAGTQGDAAKAVQNFPSVSRSAFGTGQLVVWGSAPRDTRVYVDGIEVPNLYHFGGVRSVVPARLVRSVDLVPGGFGVEYGRALGGIARVETKTLPAEGIHGAISADLYDASVLFQAALSDRFRAGVSVRYSYIDAILGAIAGPDIGDVYPVPRYHDGTIKASLRLGGGKELSVIASHIGDELERVLPSSDPTLRRSEKVFDLTERIAMRFRAADERGTTTDVEPWFGFDIERHSLDFGTIPASSDDQSMRYGLRAEHKRTLVQTQERGSRWVAGVELKIGLDAAGVRMRSLRDGTLTIPPREGDIVAFGQPPGEEQATDAWTAHILDLDPYASITVRLGPLTLVPGVRFNGTLIDVSRATPPIGLTPAIGSTRFEPTLDPRFCAQLAVGERLFYQVSAGLYHQPPDPRDLSPVFGTPSLGTSRAVHVTLGQSAKLTDTLSTEMVGFYKSLSDLPMHTDQTSPPLAHALTDRGEGTAYGVNLVVRQAPIYGFSGWLSYSLSRAERWLTPREVHRLFDFDQTHLLTLLLNQSVAGFDFGLRFRVGSGMPRTPVIGAYYNAKDDRYEPVFGDQNSVRLPLFYQLDLRAQKVFDAGPTQIAVFADVQNVTSAENPEEIAYSWDYAKKDYIGGLPVLAVIGSNLTF